MSEQMFHTPLDSIKHSTNILLRIILNSTYDSMCQISVSQIVIVQHGMTPTKGFSSRTINIIVITSISFYTDTIVTA